MNDPTESVRRELIREMQSRGPLSRDHLEETFGRAWSTQELAADFEVLGFLAPFVIVRRKCDGVKGSLKFQHDPRLYFEFVEEEQSTTAGAVS